MKINMIVVVWLICVLEASLGIFIRIKTISNAVLNKPLSLYRMQKKLIIIIMISFSFCETMVWFVHKYFLFVALILVSIYQRGIFHTLKYLFSVLCNAYCYGWAKNKTELKNSLSTDNQSTTHAVQC